MLLKKYETNSSLAIILIIITKQSRYFTEYNNFEFLIIDSLSFKNSCVVVGGHH